VRTEAAKALANIPDDRAVPSLLRHLEGTLPASLVRRDRSGLPTLGTAANLTAGLGLAEDHREAKDVRIACADALRNFRTTEVARALVNALQDRDFGVAYTARKSLKGMTGMDLGYDQAAWLKYLTQVPKPFG
jgi:HEAT repeat protein